MVSVGLHVSLLCSAVILFQWSTRLNPVTIQMGEIGDPGAAESDKAPGLGVPKPPPPAEKPKPDPPKPDPPKPDPPKPDPPKPDPPKPDPPKPDPPKPDPPKPEKPEKKPEPEKPEKKPEPEKPVKPEKKTEPPKKDPKKAEANSSGKKDPKATSTDPKSTANPTKTAPGKAGSPTGLPSQTGPAKPGVRSEGMPSVLDGWCRNLQRKVEGVWVMPEGMILPPDNQLAEVAFSVDRAGNLMDTPRVVKEAADPGLGQSGVNAIMMAAPFPPLPEAYERTSLTIVYVFGVE